MRPLHTLSVRQAFASARYELRSHLYRPISTLQEQSRPHDVEQPPYVPHRLPETPVRSRRITNPRPFSDFLTDTFARQHDYLRISLTERCNLRCLYCMPEEGVQLSPSRDILTTPEIEHLSRLFVTQGVKKIRLTGGEPTVRSDILPLMHKIGNLRSLGLKELALTTNGISLHRKLDSMVEAGLTGVNISLDTLDPFQYQILTRRQGYSAVMKGIERVKELNKVGAGIKLKINCVVMRGLNDHQVLPFVEMTREEDLEVRFIEYMPFDGNKWSKDKMMSYAEMLELIRTVHPAIARLQDAHTDTSKTWQVPGFAGRVGFITSMTHNFCGSCNRLRITSDGNLKVCLHGNAEVSLRDIMRQANGGEPIDEVAYDRLQHSTLRSQEQSLLQVIGGAVKRKKEKHAGIGELEKMKNRPMILIAKSLASDSTIRSLSTALLRADVSRPSHSGPTFHSATLHSRGLSSMARDAQQSLTHVNKDGKATMVDVGSKQASKRIAIATASIIFSNATAVEQIRLNTNKKGDVLAIARIAGIMAAKRTSDLIPLCHPLMLSKVTVDAVPRMPGRGTKHGCVDISARVECTGQTGVEMEALTAASMTALTIYDMCKAVDKSMIIRNAQVVYKSGGKSGTHIDKQWLALQDKDAMTRDGLDMKAHEHDE